MIVGVRQLLPSFGKHFPFGIPNHPAKRCIHLQHAAVRRAHPHTERRAFKDRAESLFAFPKLALGLQPRSDIARDRGSAHYFSGWISDRGESNRDIDPASILALADRVVRNNCTPVQHGREIVKFLTAVIWKEKVNVLSCDFPARIAEQLFGAVVPTDDRPLQVDALNRVVRGILRSRPAGPASARPLGAPRCHGG